MFNHTFVHFPIPIVREHQLPMRDRTLRFSYENVILLQRILLKSKRESMRSAKKRAQN